MKKFLSVVTSVLLTFSICSTLVYAKNPAPATNTYFANTLQSYFKSNPEGSVISAKMIDLDGDKAKEMLVYKFTPAADSSRCMAGNIYIFDYEKGKGAKTGTISFSGAGSQPLFKLSSTKNLIESGNNGSFVNNKVYTYKNKHLTCTVELAHDQDEFNSSMPYSINNKAVTKAQYDTAFKKYGIANATDLIVKGSTQLPNNELQSIIASDKTISSKADYKKRVYMDFIHSGAYQMYINDGKTPYNDENYNKLICYAMIPSDKSGNYDLVLIYTNQLQLNVTSKAQIMKSLDKTNSMKSDSFYRFSVYRNVSGVIKRITPVWCDGYEVRGTSLSVFTNIKTGAVRYFIYNSYGGGDTYTTLFIDMLNNTNLKEASEANNGGPTYYKNDNAITKVDYDKAMSDLTKDNKSLNITYTPYSK